MTALTEPLTDKQGRALFSCKRCSRPLTGDDLIAQGLRLPDPGESRDEYLESELIDDLDHVTCDAVSQAS
jgi:hypothetical protein